MLYLQEAQTNCEICYNLAEDSQAPEGKKFRDEKVCDAKRKTLQALAGVGESINHAQSLLPDGADYSWERRKVSALMDVCVTCNFKSQEVFHEAREIQREQEQKQG